MDLHTPPDREAERAQAADDLRHAQRLDREARTAARWYTRYLFAFGLASFVMAALFGVVGPFWGAAVLTPLWLVFVTAISVWTQNHRTRMRGLTRSNTLMILGWAIAWGLTVVIGSYYFPYRMWWWVLGGLVMATPPMLAARAADRSTRTSDR